MNIRRLERHIKSLTGLSPRQYRSVLRFRHAVRLLHCPAARPIDVAYRAGYCDQAHFNHAFKRFSGLTPCQYIRHSVSP